MIDKIRLKGFVVENKKFADKISDLALDFRKNQNYLFFVPGVSITDLDYRQMLNEMFAHPHVYERDGDYRVTHYICPPTERVLEMCETGEHEEIRSRIRSIEEMI